ncbi:hypothetical protein F0562_014810 [Nyssa sinensis]|uniref:Uncharacterized protein n=1 Tax=Nyssa sinensis TaxID=561372 RepID=A0A5J4ZRU8_9ASTE|nr:hypothetical protein F0562_014810 [Nyssa sinensis]
MTTKRGLSSTTAHRNRGGGSRFPIAILVFFSVLALLVFFVGRGLHTTTSIDQNDIFTGSGKQDVDWRERLALQHVKSLFSKEVIDIVTANTDDLGPLSLDFFRKNNLSSSWNVVGLDTSVENNATSAEPNHIATRIKQQTPRIKKDDSSGGKIVLVALLIL